MHSSTASLPVGVTTTFGGFSADSVAEVRSLNAHSDVIIVTYYPLQDAAQVRAPTSPAADLPMMISLADDRPVVLQEAGYPSDALNGSSERLQADFVTSLLSAWRAVGEQMPFLNYFLLYDFDDATCAALGTYYGSSDPAFLSYLCTLGLHRADGSEKTAWSAFISAARQ